MHANQLTIGADVAFGLIIVAHWLSVLQGPLAAIMSILGILYYLWQFGKFLAWVIRKWKNRHDSRAAR